MKSYFLTPIASRDAAIAALSAALPIGNKTWLLRDKTGEIMAYFYVAEPDATTADRMVIADISGRHYNCDADVVAVLQKLRTELGGEITNDV